jgi:hypothetical protein
VLITYIKPTITLDQLCEEIRDMCRFTMEQHFTVKWVDEEGMTMYCNSKCTIIDNLFIFICIAFGFLMPPLHMMLAAAAHIKCTLLISNAHSQLPYATTKNDACCRC